MITAGLTRSFLLELAQGVHDFTPDTGDVFALALYTADADLDETTAAYTAQGEVATGGGYEAGGFLWTAAQNIAPQEQGGVVFWSWSTDPTWDPSSITARGGLIYNTSKDNRAVAVLDFGEDKTSVDAAFAYHLPANAAGTALIRLSAAVA